MTGLRAGVALAPLTTLRVGGPAARLAECTTEADLVEAVRTADAAGEPVLVLGGGSNVVVADDGFPGTVVRVMTAGEQVTRDGDTVVVTLEAGENWDDVVVRCVEEGLAGVEFLSGVPGLTGATPIQNVGAYGQEVAETIEAVRVLDRHTGEITEMTPEECAFTYRDSVFKSDDRRVVLAVTFRLRDGGLSAPVRYAEVARVLGVEEGGQVPLAVAREAVLELRTGKGMVLQEDDHDTWSAGSFFTNPLVDGQTAARLPDDTRRWPMPDGRVKVSAAWLIEHAGFGKGYGNGFAKISTKHTLALTNRGGATTADLLALAREVRGGVLTAFDVELTCEPVLVGEKL
ncbi:MAG: UDP-N-acetylmuramate dehydrogenase [Streptosporangiales bacterium]|nr:UDP-N-acetylmuramate dehydrogenase [Streptosporangiales bacterium]